MRSCCVVKSSSDTLGEGEEGSGGWSCVVRFIHQTPTLPPSHGAFKKNRDVSRSFKPDGGEVFKNDIFLG